MLAMDQPGKWLQQNYLNGSNDKNVQLTEHITEKMHIPVLLQIVLFVFIKLHRIKACTETEHTNSETALATGSIT